MADRENIFFTFFLLLFFFLRIYKIGTHDLWYDEVATVGYAQYPWSNWNAPLYWIVLHFWIKLFAVSEFTLRLPSALFSFLSLIIIFLLGKELFNKKTGIIASVIMGLSPFHLWYAQEARDYSMVLFLGLLSNWLFYKTLRKSNFKLWIAFVLVSLAGIYTNYFYIFLFISQGAYILFFEKLNFRIIISFLLLASGFVLYLSRFLSKFYFVWQGFWIPRPQWKSLIITLENFILGYSGFDFLYGITNVLTGLFFTSAIAAVCTKAGLRKNFALCLFLFFIPVICVLFFSRIFFSIYLDRGLIIFSPYFYLILSLGIFFLKQKVKVVLLTILIAIFLVADYGYFKDWMFMPLEHHLGTYIKKPVKPVVEFLKDNLAPQDILAFTNESTIPSLRFYSQGRRYPSFYYFFDPKFPDSSWLRPIQEDSYNIPFYKVNNLKFKRLWVISSDWGRSGNLDENSQAVKNWLDKNLRLELVKEFEGLWIFRYSK